METINTLLDAGGEMTLVINWQRMQVNCILVFHGRQNL